MTVVNHWGKWVNSDIPVTGVLSIHSIDWEWFDYNDEICLDCQQAYIELDETHEDNEDGKPDPEYYDVECDSSHTKLIGDWIQGEDGKYEPDKTGEYAAIENETTVQVVWSKYTAKGALCSPCYPGQVDLDSKGEFLGYTLPPELLHKEN